jgi:hypothetical protein
VKIKAARGWCLHKKNHNGSLSLIFSASHLIFSTGSLSLSPRSKRKSKSLLGQKKGVVFWKGKGYGPLPSFSKKI